MGFMKIGEVAKQTEVGIETIRYYERIGLLAEPQRKPSGYRQYDKAVVARLQFIRRTKELGFTLAEIKESCLAFGSTPTQDANTFGSGPSTRSLILRTRLNRYRG